MMSCEAKCKYWKPVLNFISYYLFFHLHANKHWFIVYQADIKWDIIQIVVFSHYNNVKPVLLLLCLLLL